MSHHVVKSGSPKRVNQETAEIAASAHLEKWRQTPQDVPNGCPGGGGRGWAVQGCGPGL